MMDETRNEHDEQIVQLITSLQPELFAFIRSLTLRADFAEEALQETNIVLWQKRGEFKLGTNFRSWAFQTARFKVLSLAAGVSRRVRLNDELVAQVSQMMEQRSEPEREAQVTALRLCLTKLPPPDRELIERHYAGARDHDMAADLHRPAYAVYRAAARIRRVLLRCIRRQLAAEGLE